MGARVPEHDTAGVGEPPPVLLPGFGSPDCNAEVERERMTRSATAGIEGFERLDVEDFVAVSVSHVDGVGDAKG